MGLNGPMSYLILQLLSKDVLIALYRIWLNCLHRRCCKQIACRLNRKTEKSKARLNGRKWTVIVDILLPIMVVITCVDASSSP